MTMTAGVGEKKTEEVEEIVIRARGLSKRYGDAVAVDGVDLDVGRGEIFGILGPEGAGKTTTLGMIEGRRTPDAGEIEVAGYDAVREADEMRRLVGIQHRATALFDYLSVRELLEVHAELHDADASPSRIGSLLETTALTGEASAGVEGLPGASRRRLSLALALVGDPQILFLDEPTAGLDPQSRRGLWDVVRNVRRDGKTVVLATRCAREAEELCDRVAIMDGGRLLVCDTPRALVHSLGAHETVLATLDGPLGPHPDASLDLLPGVTREEREAEDVRLETDDAGATVAGLMRFARERGLEVRDLLVKSAPLEDALASYTAGTSYR